MINEGATLNLNSDQSSQKKDNLPLIVLAVTGVLFFICFAVVFVFARHYLQSKTVIVLEPDYSKLANVSRDDLEKTAQILTERCDQIGYSSVSFIVTEDNQIIGQVPAFMNWNTDREFLERITVIGLLEFVDFGDAPLLEGIVVRTDFTHPFFMHEEGKIWHTVMTNDKIDSAKVIEDMLGSYAIEFALTEEGTKLFFDYTSDNVNTYLGIVLDKVIISSPIINSPIQDGVGQISGQFTKEEAMDLAVYLKVAPLPIPIVVTEILGGDQ